MRTCDGHFRDHVSLDRHNVSSRGHWEGIERERMRTQQLLDTFYASCAHKVM